MGALSSTSGPEVVVSRTYTSNPHNPILTHPIRKIFVTATMRSTLISACLIGLAAASCSVSSPELKAKASDDKNFMAECITALEGQIAIEFEASLQYLLMAAHFSQDTVNLPKLAAFFWEHADEEREHAKQFIEYLRMRGSENNSFFGGLPIMPWGASQQAEMAQNPNYPYTWAGAGEALTMALKIEKEVSGLMKEMIDTCSAAGRDDPHAADWLTGTWLEEQLNGQRHLAGLINTFNNFKRGHPELAEWLFDQEL